MVNQIRCINPAHRAQTHIAGSDAANECQLSYPLLKPSTSLAALSVPSSVPKKSLNIEHRNIDDSSDAIVPLYARINGNRDLFALPVDTLLVGDRGESYRVGTQFGERQVIVHSRSGSEVGITKQGETDMDKRFGKDGDYGLTVVYLPTPDK